MIDVAIVGAGMAGASLAARLAPHRTVVLLEAEDRPGHHATGRSAAFWTESYGGPAIQPLTLASRAELERLSVLTPRGALHIGRSAADVADFTAGFAEADRMFKATDPHARLPALAAEWTHGVWEASCADIDVAALHGHYLTTARRVGVELRTRWRVARGRRTDGAWRLESEGGDRVEAQVVVDAAGAWADEVALRCGVASKGVEPRRRTVLQVRLRREIDPAGPLVLTLDERLYWKPVGSRHLWLSPSDETPSSPVDAAPDELDVARALERFGRAIDWPVEAVERRWAGLRTFAPDRRPMVEWDGATDGFLWLAGQGGWGIQTAPAVAEIASRLLMDPQSPH